MTRMTARADASSSRLDPMRAASWLPHAGYRRADVDGDVVQTSWDMRELWRPTAVVRVVHFTGAYGVTDVVELMAVVLPPERGTRSDADDLAVLGHDWTIRGSTGQRSSPLKRDHRSTCIESALKRAADNPSLRRSADVDRANSWVADRGSLVCVARRPLWLRFRVSDAQRRRAARQVDEGTVIRTEHVAVCRTENGNVNHRLDHLHAEPTVRRCLDRPMNELTERHAATRCSPHAVRYGQRERSGDERAVPEATIGQVQLHGCLLDPSARHDVHAHSMRTRRLATKWSSAAAVADRCLGYSTRTESVVVSGAARAHERGVRGRPLEAPEPIGSGAVPSAA